MELKNPQIQKRGSKKQNENKFIKFQLHQAVNRLTKSGEKVSAKKYKIINTKKIENGRALNFETKPSN